MNTDELQQTALTIYTCRKDSKDIKTLAEFAFKKLMLQSSDRETGFAITLNDNTTVEFGILDDPRETTRQASGMQNFFSKAPLENQRVKQAALTQIGLFNCIIGIRFDINRDTDRTNKIIDSIYHLAEKLYGFVLYPNMYLFHWSSTLLISIDGKTEMEEFYPVADGRMLDEEIPETETDIARKNCSMEICRRKEIYVPEHLRNYVTEGNCRIPEKAEILRRAICIFATGVCSEIFREGGSRDTKQFMDILNALEEQYSFRASLSPLEQSYIKDPLKHNSDHIYYDWRYEDCNVLLWALGYTKLGEPDHTCDVSLLGDLIFKNNFESLMANARPKSKEEILDLQDLIYRYDWACVEARVKGSHPENLDPSVVYEWHYALNWLTGAGGITEWDLVRPNT